MKYLLSLGVGLGLLLWGAAGLAAPEKKVAPIKATINPSSSWTITVSFKGGERANIIVMGEGKSHLGLYVYDAKKNCVAHDDDVGGKYLDDRWVIWYPSTTQTYTIEVRNLSNTGEAFEIAIR